MEKVLVGVFILFYVVALTDCYPQGAPVRPESCEALQPIHVNRATRQRIGNQVGQAPYRIFISQNKFLPCGVAQRCGQYPITVSIRGVPAQTATGIQGQPTAFRGFIIQARTASRGNRAVGQFIPGANTKMITCTNGYTLTHTSNMDKQDVRFQWIPEPGLREDVQFVSTIVQNLNMIYPLVYSPKAQASTQNAVGAAGLGVGPTTKRPSTTTTTTSTTTTTTTSTTTSVTTLLPTDTSTGFFNSASRTSAGIAVTIISLLMILL